VALKSSGQLTIAEIRSEMAAPAGVGLQDLYRGGPYTPDNSFNTGVPTSGQIKITDFYGTSGLRLVDRKVVGRSWGGGTIIRLEKWDVTIPLQVIVTGGSTPYTYSWSWTSATTTNTSENPFVQVTGASSSTLNFRFYTSGYPGFARLSNPKCTVTDASGTQLVVSFNSIELYIWAMSAYGRLLLETGNGFYYDGSNSSGQWAGFRINDAGIMTSRGLMQHPSAANAHPATTNAVGQYYTPIFYDKDIKSANDPSHWDYGVTRNQANDYCSYKIMFQAVPEPPGDPDAQYYLPDTMEPSGTGVWHDVYDYAEEGYFQALEYPTYANGNYYGGISTNTKLIVKFKVGTGTFLDHDIPEYTNQFEFFGTDTGYP